MKTKTFSSVVKLAGTLVCFLLFMQASAQQANTTKSTPTQAQRADQANYMMPVEQIKKASNGAIIINAQGTVELQVTNDNGQLETITVSKPSVDFNQSVEAGYETYVTNYITWMKANPEYANYISTQELQFIQSENYSDLYKQNYIHAEKTTTQNK